MQNKTCQFLLCFLLISGYCLSAEFPTERQDNHDVFPRPKNSVTVEANPPAFVWLPVEEAASYTLTVRNKRNNRPALKVNIEENVYAPQSMLTAGEYEWTVEAFYLNDSTIAVRRPYDFSLPKNCVEFPFPDIEHLYDQIKSYHPRLVFDKNDLEDIRSTLNTTRAQAWQNVKKMADKSLNIGVPRPPWYEDIEEYTPRRLEYRKYYHYLRPYIDQGLQSLSLAWLMTGDEKYLNAAKRILFEVIQWPADGITSVKHIGFDEPGLSFAKCLHRAYDWLYNGLAEAERERVRQHLIARARDTWQRVGINRPFLQRPGSSHDGRLIGYLCEQALVLAGEAPEDDVKKWLDHSLTAFWTVFPHWRGRDGGWAEGIGYAATYNIRATVWIESCVSALNLDLWEKPYFQKIRNYFLYCARPNDEFWPFGDGAERGPRSTSSRAKLLRPLMSHYAQRFKDPACQWWANNVPLDDSTVYNPIVPMILSKKINAKAPEKHKNASVFSGIGWAALHSDLAHLENDIFFLFKSSPFGSVSHNHADQNSFYLSVGGRALAIPSGYYGPVYGMPHHAEWTRSTKANNTILVNGKGQKKRDFRAVGSITTFNHQDKLSYFCGDAAPAYKGALQTFKRHVMYVRPNLFVILDELEAPEPAAFQWLLHAPEKMIIDEHAQSIEIHRHQKYASFRLYNSTDKPFAFTQTNKFDPPYDTGTDSTFHVTVEKHWHLQAETQSQNRAVRIAAILHADNESVQAIDYQHAGGWAGARIENENGIATVWARLATDAPLPESLSVIPMQNNSELVVVGIWQSNDAQMSYLSNLSLNKKD